MIEFSAILYSFTVILVLICVMHNGNAFNLSPKPNIVFREPKASGVGMPKMRSSYFGFSLNLKQNSVLVGAPRAQSTIEVQRKINETGAIYKCTFDKSASCAPFIFDRWGNVHEDYNQYAYNNEKKDYQWLGASMDSGASDTDKFVVCAPRLISDVTNHYETYHYLMHGICYFITNTSSARPSNVQKIAPLRFKDKQHSVIEQERYFYYMYGEQGMSVHVTENNEEILIGAPGIFTWKGSVIRHKAKPLVDLGGLSRRNEDGVSVARQRSPSDLIEYHSDIPNPMLWRQDDNSYFGFAVSSGYFDGIGKTKLLYLASAPQANQQEGAVYIFDIIDHYSALDKTIKIYHTFSGQQFGEYFGYSLLTEDFDNDGLTDVAIGAPYNSKIGYRENGAVYIYRNEGTSSNFALHAILRTEYESDGRFGTTMSKVGDVNQDGYNDLVVAAPFEEDGVVYIYHGSSNGLSTKYSQRIASPSSNGGLAPNHMFGHGVSKGADIDGNQYLDLAVGAPNAEAVYIYKSYPVIRINATITPFSQEIQTTDKSFKFNVCWLYESTFPINFDVHFNATIKLDGQLGRAVFSDRKNEFDIVGVITPSEQCTLLEAFVTFSIAEIFRPIEMEMTHHILNNIPKVDDSSETQEFCEKCVAVNPLDSKNVKNKIVFSTGCKSARCIADLKITSSLENVPSLPYVLGSSQSINIVYKIENSGETAYLAQIRITLPESVLFSKIPSNCKFDENAPNSNIMECDLNNGSPMFKGDKTSIKMGIDTTKLDGNELIVKAKVYSTGDELNDLDNIVENLIPLKTFNNMEVIGDSIKSRLTLESGVLMENLTHIFEIRNNGPSNIKSLDILVSLPVSHINPWTLERERLIDLSSVSIKSMYNGKQFNVEWTQNNTILILDATESSTSSSSSNTPVEDNNGMQFDASKYGQEYDLSGGQSGNSQIDDFIGDRKRRSTENVHSAYFNPYLQRIIETDAASSNIMAWDDTNFIENRHKRDIFSTNDRILSNLPSNRTIYFDCKNAEQELCLQGKFTVNNIKADDQPILITLNFTIDLTKVANIMTEKRDVFVIRTSVDLMKTSDEEDTSSLNVIQNQPFTIISKYVITSTPLWVYILSTLVGILSLILISYALHRFGFFKRGKREELVQLKRQSQNQSYYPPDDDQF
ncbi:integrin alpha-PS3-like [Contarinia nasturtii]|uniref:integrin alpha-PS3-like n=1 Tax=Contarinia nasturtii TaxID=265458 RepID=UPI0012D3EA3F|nr:integrin alpha-PS3-like [Contarinia nasturtii]